MLPEALAPNVLPITKTLDFLDPESDGSDILFLSVNQQGLSSLAPQGQQTLTIDPAIDFYWYLSTLQADVAGAADAGGDAYTEANRPIPMVNIRVTDVSSQKALENFTIPVQSRFGTGENPYRLICPRVLRGSMGVQFTFTAIIAANTTYTNLFLTLHGFSLPREGTLGGPT